MKKIQETERTPDGMTISGLLCSCQTRKTEGGVTEACLDICTGERRKGDRETERNYHRVYTRLHGGEAERKYRRLETECAEMRRAAREGRRPAGRIFISLMGRIIADGTDCRIVADSRDIRFPKGRMRERKAEAVLKGKVTRTFRNPDFASVIIDTGKFIMPVIIGRRRNTAGWRDITEGRIKEGEEVTAAGTIAGRRYTDGTETRVRISLDAKDIRRMEKKEERKEERTASPEGRRL